MMYKVGDEVYVKARVVDTDTSTDLGYKCKVQFADSINDEWDWVSDKTVSDKTYEQGLADSWNLLKKVYDMKFETIEQIFDVEGGFWNVIRDFTYEEALAKIEAYEREKEIKVGSIVTGISGRKGVVARVCGSNSFYVMWEDGSCGAPTKKDLKSTGRMAEGLEGLLRQIGE